MGYKSFHKDLAKATKTEYMVLELLKWHFNDVNHSTKSIGNNDRFDLIMNRGDDTHLVEIKEDFRCMTTGNLAIELASNGKPSGLSVTHSHWWVTVAHYMAPVNLHRVRIYLSETDDIRELVEDINRGRMVTGGDKGVSKLFVTPRHYVEELSETVIDTDIHSYEFMVELATVIHREGDTHVSTSRF